MYFRPFLPQNINMERKANVENAYKEWVYNEIFRTIAERCEKAQQESSEDREDEFNPIVLWRIGK